ncbi:MAG: mycothiol system anti-sigma-R factor [Nocardioides sp.]
MSHSHDPEDAAECVDFLESIVYLIDNELSDDDRASVIGHIETCTPCLVKYDLQRTVKALVARSCTETAPSALRAKVMVALTEVRVQINTDRV